MQSVTWPTWPSVSAEAGHLLSILIFTQRSTLTLIPLPSLTTAQSRAHKLRKTDLHVDRTLGPPPKLSGPAEPVDFLLCCMYRSGRFLFQVLFVQPALHARPSPTGGASVDASHRSDEDGTETGSLYAQLSTAQHIHSRHTAGYGASHHMIYLAAFPPVDSFFFISSLTHL